MAIRRPQKTNPKPKRPQETRRSSRSKTIDSIIVAVESPNSERPSKHRQASSRLAVDPPSREAPSNKEPTVEGLPKDRQPMEDSTTDLVLEDPPASGNPSQNQPIVESLSEDQQPEEGLTVVPPAAEAPSEVAPERESSTNPSELTGVPEDRPTADVQSEDQQTAEGRTSLQAGAAPEDLPALESPPNGQSPTAGPARELLDGEILKEPTESSSEDESTTEHPSEDDTTEDLPIIAPPTDRQKLSREEEREKVLTQVSKRKVIYIDSGDESDNASPPPVHRPHKRRKHSPKGLVNPPAPDSPSNGKPNSRRNANRLRVKPREFKDYVDIEKGWLDSSLSKCRKFLQFCEDLNQDIILLKALNTKACQKFDRSVRSLTREALLDRGAELKILEMERCRMTKLLRRNVDNFTAEAKSMGEDLERWYAQENKFTGRIERSC